MFALSSDEFVLTFIFSNMPMSLPPLALRLREISRRVWWASTFSGSTFRPWMYISMAYS
jgi:hypothetical protein